MNSWVNIKADASLQPAPELVDRVNQWLELRDQYTPLLRAFCEELPAGRWRRNLQGLLEQLDAGVAAEALCQSRAHLSTVMPLLASEEHAGVGPRLERVLSESLRDDQLNRKRLRVMAYPAGVLALALLVMSFLSLTVTPVFEEVFDEFALDLPAMTQATLVVSHALTRSTLWLVCGLATIVALAIVASRYVMASGPYRLSQAAAFATRGSSQSVAAMATFTQRLADGLAAQLPETVAIRTAAEVSPGRFLRRAATRLATEAEPRGEPRVPLASLKTSAWFPAVMIHLVDQEPNNQIATARRLEAYADALTERFESRFDWSTGVVAQLAVVTVGGVVALVLVAMLLPMVSLVSALS
ncbi:MAG: type II secretion system F family protein [Planctomycetota bacterium]